VQTAALVGSARVASVSLRVPLVQPRFWPAAGPANASNPVHKDRSNSVKPLLTFSSLAVQPLKKVVTGRIGPIGQICSSSLLNGYVVCEYSALIRTNGLTGKDSF
jgi:hypothetical protein